METAEYDEEKSHEDTSKMAPSVNAQKLDANQLAAKILHLRMKEKKGGCAGGWRHLC